MKPAKKIPRPLILISPDVETEGKEFRDLSTSLSANYQRAILEAGGLPAILPMTDSREAISELVSRAEGVLLTGGDDVEPRLYLEQLSKQVKSTIETTPDGGQRDFRELLLINEVFNQRKPLLAICRGHQLLNVALGGTLVPDIPSYLPKSLNHRRMDLRSEVVHEARLTPGSLLSKITATQNLSVNSTHHQAVGKVAPPLCVSARGPDGIVEGLELRSAGDLPFLISVQFHPERLADRYPPHAAIFKAFTQACVDNRTNHHL